MIDGCDEAPRADHGTVAYRHEGDVSNVEAVARTEVSPGEPIHISESGTSLRGNDCSILQYDVDIFWLPCPLSPSSFVFWTGARKIEEGEQR